jgi:diguanylate cyclase (GGDEF)-like protein
MSNSVESVLSNGSVRTLFQPIIDGFSGAVFAVEALSRGPKGSPLEQPVELFRAAIADKRLEELERACLTSALRSFAALALDCRLFLNVSPQTLLSWPGFAEWLVAKAHELKVDPHLLVIEVTEHGNQSNDVQLAEALRPLRALGCEIAIDDLGAGSSGLKSWSAIRPEFVKVDRYFVDGAEQDPVRAEILRSVVDIGRATGSQIIAEGVENPGQLNLVMDLGVDYVQGFLLGRPEPKPAAENSHLCGLQTTMPSLHADCAEHLATPIPAVPHAASVASVVETFQRHPEWRAIAVVEGTQPVGLVRRDELLILLSRPLFPEVYNRKPISAVMDTRAVQIDARARLEQVSRMVTGYNASKEQDDFIITRGGEYLGLGRTMELLRQITAQQIQAAKQANPLTGLPGNRVIHSHVERWVKQSRGFIACHLDLDHFKPFNDAYGYSHGDQVLMHVAGVLTRCARPRVDFVGHIGGDDFVMLLRSRDWQLRLAAVLDELAASLPSFHAQGHRADAGFDATDRAGAHRRFPLISVSIAAMEVPGDAFVTVEAVTEGLLKTKAEAKAREGNVCMLSTRNGVIDLFGSSRGLGSDASFHLQQRSAAVLRHG